MGDFQTLLLMKMKSWTRIAVEESVLLEGSSPSTQTPGRPPALAAPAPRLGPGAPRPPPHSRSASPAAWWTPPWSSPPQHTPAGRQTSYIPSCWSPVTLFIQQVGLELHLYLTGRSSKLQISESFCHVIKIGKKTRVDYVSLSWSPLRAEPAEHRTGWWSRSHSRGPSPPCPSGKRCCWGQPAGTSQCGSCLTASPGEASASRNTTKQNTSSVVKWWCFF